MLDERDSCSDARDGELFRPINVTLLHALWETPMVCKPGDACACSDFIFLNQTSKSLVHAECMLLCLDARTTQSDASVLSTDQFFTEKILYDFAS